MADANLLEILNKESKLENMIIYGNIKYAIDKPSFLSDSVQLSDGFFALVDVLAFKCNGVDYFSDEYYDSKHIYFSKGSLVIVINDKNLIGKNVRIYGRTLKGCTVKKQRTNSSRDGIVAFVWARVGNDWVIVPNKVVELGDSDVKGTVLEDYVVSVGSGIPFTRPSSVESFVEYKGVQDAKPVEVEDIKSCIEYSTEPVDLSSIELNLTHRLEKSSKSEYVGAVEESVNSLTKKSKEYARRLVVNIEKRVKEEESNEETEDNLKDIAINVIDSFIERIATMYNLQLSVISKVKGKEFVDDLLDGISNSNFVDSSDEEERLTKEEKLAIFKEIENIRKTVPLKPSVLKNNTNKVPIMNNVYKYASIIIGCVTGVGIQSMVTNHNSVVKGNGLDTKEWFWCLIHVPYLCGLMGSGLNVMDCDRIFYSFSENYDKEECVKYRDMILMLNSIKDASSRSTLISKRELYGSSKYPKLGTRYIADQGLPFSKDCYIAVNLMVGNKLDSSMCLSNNIDMKDMIGKLYTVGLIELVNNGVMLVRDLKKEFVIYKFLQERGTELTDIEDKGIEEVIEKFEKDKGFKLEKLQKDGVHLVKYKAGVLSGCAGSGKTTTSDCMVECFKKFKSKYNLKFGAPTGKAARRLAEVVGGDVKTIHSMFGIGLDEEPYLSKNEKRRFRKNKEGGDTIYILDEMAMCNTNLMYEIVDNLGKDDLVYFLGDIKQLPPIGKGSPFRSLMQFLPCVELGVSKRAAENGKINYNCGLINFLSDENIVELQEGEDFKIKPCKDAEILLGTVKTFSNMLNEFDEDDIQVVTGYQNDKYPWGTIQLNPSLQNLLRKEEELLYTYNMRKFMVNDRVIHTRRNAYDMPRFRMTGRNSFEELVTFGVVNGELGKIVGYVKSEDCYIKPYVNNYSNEELEELGADFKELVDKRENTSVDIRNEENYKSDTMYYVIVQVYDVDLKEDVYVLYHANFKDKQGDYIVKNFTGGDLAYLDLAYALTTHKMQGSQSPCIIIPLGSSSNSSFMNRNMINTMITRASKKVVLLGSVKGKDSALTNGRRITSVDDGRDVLGILSV